MAEKKGEHWCSSIILAGAYWGIFEATVGYMVHLLPFKIGFLIWYPAAVYFLFYAYRQVGQRWAVLLTAVLSACVKLTNLLLPVRVDMVINPAISIILEGFAVYLGITVAEHLGEIKKEPAFRMLFTICINVGYRLLFIGYLALLAPVWIREVSILQSTAKLIRFLFTDALYSSVVVWLGLQYGQRVLAWLHGLFLKLPLPRWREIPRPVGAGILLTINLFLQFVL